MAGNLPGKVLVYLKSTMGKVNRVF
ncbi:hypothetical protein C5167_029592 [Papaver somniferum]|nr:hypothetical protein C5167_029592 [Papaver somniferum]